MLINPGDIVDRSLVAVFGGLGHMVALLPVGTPFGMPVEVVYADALGRKDREGNSYLSYFFRPAAG